MVGRAVQIDDITAWSLLELSRMVVRLMGFHDCSSYGVEDLVHVGVVAALEAYPRWNSDKGKLSTFFTPRIRGAIKDFLRQLNGRYGRRPDFSAKHFSEIEGEENFLADTMEGSTLDTIVQVEAREAIKHWARERCISRTTMLILLCRYGSRMTMADTARVVGITESRVCQIESSLRLRYGLENLYKSYGCQRTIIGDDSPISKNLRNLRKGRQ